MAKNMLGIPMPTEMREKVRALAREEEMSDAAWARRLIKREIARVEKKQKRAIPRRRARTNRPRDGER